MRYESRIIGLSRQFRSAIEKAVAESLLAFNDRMSRFPNGCCDDACDLLAYYLQQNGISTIQVNGVYRGDNPQNTQNHVWLRTNDGLLIDITGDQFSRRKELLYYDVPVYVGYEDTLHKLFAERKEYPSFNFESNDGPGEKRMMSIYKIIHEYL